MSMFLMLYSPPRAWIPKKWPPNFWQVYHLYSGMTFQNLIFLSPENFQGFRVPKSWKVVFLPVPISMPALADVEAHPSKLVFRATSCARVVAVERISSSNIADFMNVCFIISLLLYLVSFILNLAFVCQLVSFFGCKYKRNFYSKQENISKILYLFVQTFARLCNLFARTHHKTHDNKCNLHKYA